jgi:hypothetical protein
MHFGWRQPVEVINGSVVEKESDWFEVGLVSFHSRGFVHWLATSKKATKISIHYSAQIPINLGEGSKGNPQI